VPIRRGRKNEKMSGALETMKGKKGVSRQNPKIPNRERGSIQKTRTEKKRTSSGHLGENNSAGGEAARKGERDKLDKEGRERKKDEASGNVQIQRAKTMGENSNRSTLTKHQK